MNRFFPVAMLCLVAVGVGSSLPALAQHHRSAPAARLIRSARSGLWSAAATWQNGIVPPSGASVLIRSGHRVVYDRNSAKPLRAVYVSGALRFDPDRDTRLDVGLIKIQPGEMVSENGWLMLPLGCG